MIIQEDRNKVEEALKEQRRFEKVGNEAIEHLFKYVFLLEPYNFRDLSAKEKKEEDEKAREIILKRVQGALEMGSKRLLLDMDGEGFCNVIK